MEDGTKVKVKSVPGDSLYQRFVGMVGKVNGKGESGSTIRVEFEGNGLLFLTADQIEPA